MADYAKMYFTLFHAQTEAIEILSKAQSDSEDIYISAPSDNIHVLPPRHTDSEDDE